MRRPQRTLTRCSLALTIIASQVLFDMTAHADEEKGILFPNRDPGRAWTLTVENDIFAGTDGGYTNGLGFSIAHGPSLAEPSQRLIHRVTGSETPMGWHNQLENEVVFQVEASHGRRLYRPACQ